MLMKDLWGYEAGGIMRLKHGQGLRIGLLLLVALLAGCYQQAGETFRPSGDSAETITTPDNTPLPLPPPTNTAESENPTPVENTNIQSDAEASPTTERPTPAVAITVVSPTPRPLPTEVIASPVGDSGSSGQQLPSPTPGQFITPSGPLGPVTVTVLPVTPLTPQSNTSGLTSATPSGLITPTALPGAESADGCTHTVQPGENLYRIAVKNEISVAELRAANPQVTGDIIQPGDVLKIPNCGASGSVSAPTEVADTPIAPPAGGQVYTVQPGDTLFAIAQRFGVTIKAIQDANQLENPNRLKVGQELIIPPAS